ncbi:hypothetical protein [Qipengyuania seohaensis]|uniref:hypothetical protein n=1 Tax=Qipengyuania seohaensis TaxID=266951 RepID=UPI0012FD6913|nr:hypothetical protein [Qipengyuania seohaensis]
MTNTASIRPYKFAGAECHSTAELAASMVANEDVAKEHINEGYVQKWLEDEARDYDAKLMLDKLLDEHEGSRALFEFAMANCPDWTPETMGVPLNEETVRDYFKQHLHDDYVNSTAFSVRLAGRLYEWHLLTDERVFGKSAELAQIDAIWREELQRALTARGDMLLYESLYSVPGFDLGNSLFANRDLELDFATQALSGSDTPSREFIDATEYVSTSAHSEILSELFGTDKCERDASSRYPVEKAFRYERACEREWFKDLIARQGRRTIGPEAFLRTAALIAADQADALERVREDAAEKVAAEPDTLEDKITGFIDKLDRKKQAILFAAPVFVLLLFYMSSARYIDDLSFSWLNLAAYIAVGLTIGLAPLRLFDFSGKDSDARRKLKVPILGVLAAGIGFVLVLSFQRELYNSTVVYEALFAIAAGLAGYFREPMLAFRRKRMRATASKTAERGDKNNTKRMNIRRLQVTFFPELVMKLPRNEWTWRDHQVAAAMRNGSEPNPVTVQHADRRSPVAPNNPGGLSVNSGGANYAGDRATFEVMDGVSMDTEGNWNMRAMDGVTLHSDGKHTVSMGGIDVRSDGQMSTEIAGIRISSKGKDEKAKDNWLAPKEETDWFGNKKKKGWFD